MRPIADALALPSQLQRQGSMMGGLYWGIELGGSKVV